jgi:hypothetical protein
MTDDTPTLVDALDGVMDAIRYASDRELDDLSARLNECYQDLGERAHTADWDDRSIPELLAAETDCPKEDFEPPADVEYPPLDELETVNDES